MSYAAIQFKDDDIATPLRFEKFQINGTSSCYHNGYAEIIIKAPLTKTTARTLVRAAIHGRSWDDAFTMFSSNHGGFSNCKVSELKFIAEEKMPIMVHAKVDCLYDASVTKLEHSEYVIEQIPMFDCVMMSSSFFPAPFGGGPDYIPSGLELTVRNCYLGDAPSLDGILKIRSNNKPCMVFVTLACENRAPEYTQPGMLLAIANLPEETEPGMFVFQNHFIRFDSEEYIPEWGYMGTVNEETRMCFNLNRIKK